ncbi:B12-binding domain-containing radical SAM protein [Streptantibioticus cattleyicolor]|uniref:Putative methyltransferase n=2 Tax=Streptantibioticus cattleyicolor TaxID=29303 RepID=F8JNE0_STREN|nr:radical SAM protein [Streptantibioticus cattleyicolor]AEW99097.1 putative methyltransferase [Streptantibioticus cattleyicolor NRRL 8057 = DSM 46488]CAD18980.1 putative methyltransferase [Streptantibioticus cattleyicolor]CCB71857.1 putative methyltransferase [Streptantibioticus cattleyicolor NRRL 8057 = DSM 46488]
MRVLLVWPRNERALLSDRLSCCEPLPLEYLAGALRGAHDVTIHDLRVDTSLEEYAATHEAPDLIGVAIPYTTSVRVSRDVTHQARRLWPGTPIVLGGHHPTVSAEWLTGFAADWIVAGEGGGPLAHLAAELEAGRTPAPVRGLAPYDARTGLERDRRPKPSALDDLPMPDRTRLAHHRGRYFHSIYRPVALIRFTAGCPYTCKFCSLWRMTDRRYLVKDIDRVLAEIADIDGDNLYVVDDEAFIQPVRMLELADAIDKAGFRKKFHMYVRTDTALRRPDVIARWAEIGLDSVLVGAESMTDEELTGYRKGTDPGQTRRALDLFHGNGVKVRANFIVQPDWSEADFARLGRTVDELQVDMPSFSVLTPLPGTDLYDEAKLGLISDNPELFDCYHSLFRTRLPLERFYGELADLLAGASARTAPGVTGESDPSVFYYSDDDAFDQMLRELRRGADWSHPRESWSPTREPETVAGTG